MNRSELVDAIASKPTTVSLTTFVQLALALEMQDFNALVRAPRWSEANVVEEKKRGRPELQEQDPPAAPRERTGVMPSPAA